MKLGPKEPKPPKPYTEIKSEYIRNKLENREFKKPEDRAYIHQLMEFEQYILGNFNPGYPYGMKFSSAQKKLEEEWKTIYKQLKPNKWKKKQKQQKRNKKKREEKLNQIIQQKEHELEQSRENWEKAKQ